MKLANYYNNSYKEILTISKMEDIYNPSENSTENFSSSSPNTSESFSSQSSGTSEPISNLSSEVQSIDRELEEPLGRHKHIVDFINKFQCPTEMYSYLNEPVNQLKKRLV